MLRYGDAPDPVAGPGDVVIDIHAASVNGADPKVRVGGGRYSLSKFPHILGRDFSGIVGTVGAGVIDFKAGDAVFGVTDQGIEGAYAEKIAIKAALLAKKPASLSHAEAAALGLVSLTALTAVEDIAQLKAGQTILIQGGAGGVAGFAVQLAKHLGATVITTASAGNHAYVRGLKPGRKLVWIAAAPEGFQPPRDDVLTLRPDVKRDRAHLERMLALLDAGAVRPPTIQRYKLADAAEAHRISEARHLQGKLVLEVR